MSVAPVSSAIRHCSRSSGWSGSPSIMTIEARTSSAETRVFHSIQAVVLNQSMRSPGFRSQLSALFFRCSRRIPPWRWTIALGMPVVPEENSTNSGWSNGTGSKTRGPVAGSASSSAQPRASGTVCGP
ncbi:hypothetical protein SNARM312S_03623 [Streptomyces narbonensis]